MGSLGREQHGKYYPTFLQSFLAGQNLALILLKLSSSQPLFILVLILQLLYHLHLDTSLNSDSLPYLLAICRSIVGRLGFGLVQKRAFLYPLGLLYSLFISE